VNINCAIQKDEPHSITETSLPDDYDHYEMWEWSDHLSVMFININVAASISSCFDQHDNRRALFKVIHEYFW